REPYTVLSYHREGDLVLGLLTSNIEGRDEGTPLETMPKTLVDAIFIIRKLGIRCLWINSLCILQGYEDYQRIELASMAKIYTREF
ncbi:hypothetical protein BJ878DRAFT_422352, partial [Calycina marina]